MTVLSSAILIDGVRMHSEFEQLQRRGLPRKEGTYIDTKNAKWKALLIFNFYSSSPSTCFIVIVTLSRISSILKTNQNRIHFFLTLPNLFIWKLLFLLFLHTLFSSSYYYKIYKIYNTFFFKRSGINFQKIFKYVLNNIINMFCYKYGFCASPLFLKFWYSWCSITKWSKWFREVRWCCKPKGK